MLRKMILPLSWSSISSFRHSPASLRRPPSPPSLHTASLTPRPPPELPNPQKIHRTPSTPLAASLTPGSCGTTAGTSRAALAQLLPGQQPKHKKRLLETAGLPGLQPPGMGPLGANTTHLWLTLATCTGTRSSRRSSRSRSIMAAPCPPHGFPPRSCYLPYSAQLRGRHTFYLSLLLAGDIML